MLAQSSISSQNNPIYVRSSQTETGLKYLCHSSAGAGQGNAFTSIIFPVVFDKALKAVEARGVVSRAQQDDIHLWVDPDEIFGADGALATLLLDLSRPRPRPDLVPGSRHNSRRVRQQTRVTQENLYHHGPDRGRPCGRGQGRG